MTKPEQSKPQLSCQELSKQCNDIELSSSVTADGCWSRSNPQTQRNRQSSQYSTRNHIKVSIGIQSRLSELTEFQGLEPDLKRCSSNEPALQRQRRYLNGFGSDDDCFVVDANKEADAKCRKQAYYKTCGWLPKEVADYTHVDDNEDFLEELESSVRDQLDSELEVFRSNLLSIISQQRARCREYFSQESQDCFSQPQPPSEETYSEGRQTPSPVPDILDADSMWPSDFMHSSSDQQKTEAMSTSASSLQEEDIACRFQPIAESSGGSADAELNRIVIKLLTSALTISNALQREEYRVT